MKIKAIPKFLAAALAVVLGLSALVLPVFAASVKDATIDTSKKASLTIYKYDFTNAKKDGVWTEDSFVTTGEYESYVNETLGNATRKNGGSSSALGNSANGTSNGYAIKGVEFTIKNVADIVTFSDVVDGVNTTMVLYGFDKTSATNLLKAIGLTEADQYEHLNATHKLDSTKYYFTADTLNEKLKTALENNSTEVKNALESFVDGGIALNLTDENGYTKRDNLDLGLYLVVETKVPEMVTSTTNPFFVSLPMTTFDGGSANETNKDNGGHEWNYDVTVYPKNLTGIPTLEKTVRESKEDTGKGGDTDAIDDDFKHTATGSAGDVMEYQIISTLPNITSAATRLTIYTFEDTISDGLDYVKGDVKMEIFKDKECKTGAVETWTESDSKFSVSYTTDGRKMTIAISADGLAAINKFPPVEENVHGDKTTAAYANYTIRITYTAKLNSNATSVLGDEGNPNKVVLKWQRTSDNYYDTLEDDCHVYTFGIDLTKLFSDKDSAAAAEQFKHVKFKIQNKTDNYWLKAELDESTGIYYVTDHVDTEEEATVFTPVTYKDSNYGRIVVRGVEDDEYVLTEIETANGYTLLKDNITIVIKTSESTDCNIYAGDTLGVTQNDPRYSFSGSLSPEEATQAGVPQAHLEHKLLSASATVDGNDVTMNPDNDTTAKSGSGSKNALVPLTVVNRPGFDLPPTGERSMLLFTIVGASLMVASAMLIIIVAKKKKNQNNA